MDKEESKKQTEDLSSVSKPRKKSFKVPTIDPLAKKSGKARKSMANTML